MNHKTVLILTGEIIEYIKIFKLYVEKYFLASKLENTLRPDL